MEVNHNWQLSAGATTLKWRSKLVIPQNSRSRETTTTTTAVKLVKNIKHIETTMWKKNLKIRQLYL